MALSLKKHRLLFRNVRYKNKTSPSSSDSSFCYAALFDKSTIYFFNATDIGTLKYVSYIFQSLLLGGFVSLSETECAIQKSISNKKEAVSKPI